MSGKLKIKKREMRYSRLSRGRPDARILEVK
jgi:hypothetical protein